MPTHGTHPLRFLRGLSRSATSCSSVLAAGSCAQLALARAGLTSSSPVSSAFPGVGRAEAARAVASSAWSGFLRGVLPLPLPLVGSLNPCLSEERDVVAILGLTSSVAVSFLRCEDGPAGAAPSGLPGREARARCGLRGVVNAASVGISLSRCISDALAAVGARCAWRESASP